MAPRGTLLGCALLALSPALRSGEAAPEGARVRVVALGSAAVEGTLVSISGAALALSGRDPVPVGRVREARFLDPAAPSAARGATVALTLRLRGGEVLRGPYAGGDAEGLRLGASDLPATSVPFDLIRTVEARLEAEGEDDDPCDEPASRSPRREGADVAYTRGGDAFAGTLLSAGSSGVVVETGPDRRQSVPWTDLVVLHLDEPPLPEPEGLVAEAETVGGSRLVASSLSADAATLRATCRSGLEVALPLSSVRVVRWWGGDFVYACEVPHRSAWQHYYADPEGHLAHWYGARTDRRLPPPPERTGPSKPRGACPLRLGGTEYRHGFAVHSKSVVTIPLRGAYRSFEARFGIDDDVLSAPPGLRGSVTARVLADGKEVWSSRGAVRGGEPPKTVGPIDVEGVQELALEVDFGEDQYTNDHADWADPILVRAPAATTPR
jgi:hypothetical protein